MVNVTSITITYQQKFADGREQNITLLAECNNVRGNGEMTVAEPQPTKQDEAAPPSEIVAKKMKASAYTEEEKAEIARAYRAGDTVPMLAERFGRSPSGIAQILSKMGVKRGKKDSSPGIAVDERANSALEKPWYLKK